MKSLRLAGDNELAALLHGTHVKVRTPTAYGAVIDTETPAPKASPQGHPLVGLCKGSGLPAPEVEFRFHPERKWRFDYSWPERKIALEVDGGIWTQGRHVRGAGRLADMEKFNAAAILGWRILYYTPDQLAQALLDLRLLLFPEPEAAFR